ncbi:MAG: aminotransferase class III-fold pyridoxal phosphate-dependent enzyme [Desulfobacteraceae bacterium]|nr:aminotransferase class III-fold pyridoxal phosphate-dependent enzyme [Desulfobacteraceae bacterium]
MENVIFCTGHELLVDDIIKAENCTVYDSKGKSYTDFESGIWCTPLGHCNKKINEVIKKQTDNNIHTGFCYVNPVLQESACEILEVTKLRNGKCVFLCSGSEAVEFGIQVSNVLTDKPLMMTMSDSYLASYGTANKKPVNQWYLFNWLECSGCKNHDNCDPGCDRLSQIPFEKISSFVFEPGSSSGLVRFPPSSLITNISDKIKEVRGRGLMIAVEFNGDKDNCITRKIQHGLLQQRFFIATRPGANTIRLDPPLTVSKDEIDLFLCAFQMVLDEMQ